VPVHSAPIVQRGPTFVKSGARVTQGPVKVGSFSLLLCPGP
jgi:hypothetical protein